MTETIFQLIISSGVVGLVGSLVVSRIVNGQIDKAQKSLESDKEAVYLMLKYNRKIADLTQLMARKLHDAGVINGDLEALNKASKEVEDDYDDLMRRMYVERLK